MITVYNKLVRDKIPEIINASGKKANIKYLKGKKYKEALKNKLVEEVNEFLKAKTKEELLEEFADILEVLYAIDDVIWGDCINTTTEKCCEKHKEKGGFYSGCYLVSVEDIER